MTCSVAITGAAYTGNYEYTVSGTAVGCAEVTVSISCTTQGGNHVSHAQAAVSQSGTWQAVLEQSKCPCGQPLQISAWCTADPSCAAANFVGSVPCVGQACCPATTLSYTAAGCVNGQYQVDFVVTAVVPGGISCSYSYTLDFGDGSPPVTVTSSTSTTTPITHAYVTAVLQTYTATLTYANGCPGQTVSISVPPCSTQNCSAISFGYVVGPCNLHGTRNVAVTATYTDPGVITGTMTGTCWTGAVTGNQSGTLTLTKHLVLAAGSCTVTASFNGCPPEIFTFTVPDCCPTVDFDVEVCGDPRCKGGTRRITASATVVPQGGVSTSASLVDNASANTLDSGSGTTPFTLTATLIPYTSGTHQIDVSISSPHNCPDLSYVFCVPDCERGGCYWLHAAILVAGSVGIFLLVLKLIATAWCPLVAPLTALSNYTTTMWVSLALFGFLLLVWFIAGCASKCLLKVILWQTAFIAAILFLYLLTICFWPNLLAVIVFGVGFVLLYNWWRTTCCVGKCDALFYIHMALGLATVESLPIVATTGVQAFQQNSTLPTWMFRLNVGIVVAIGIAYLILDAIKSDCDNDCG